ncbi:MAG: SPOR domain-containing protein [Thiotrichales bacterium]|nr:SPOR domain-containing protein [Thiotrichales bacterium]
MKWLFILLLLANVAYLGWEVDRETGIHIRSRAGQAAAPERAPRLQLLTELAEKPAFRSMLIQDMNATIPGGTDSDTDAGVPAVTSPSTDFYAAMPDPLSTDDDNLLMKLVRDSGPPAAPAGSAAAVCFSYGPFAREQDLLELRQWFEQRQYPFAQRLEYEQDQEMFWVYLAPQPDRTQAEATLSELQTQGVRDYRLIRKGSFKNAISLGLFSSQAGVNRRLSELNAKGYQPVVVPYHDNKATRIFWLDVSMQAKSAITTEVFTGFPARFNSLPRDCDEIAMTENSP